LQTRKGVSLGLQIRDELLWTLLLDRNKGRQVSRQRISLGRVNSASDLLHPIILISQSEDKEQAIAACQ
jgi:hypothetical protein